jgi:hypothetical protein
MEHENRAFDTPLHTLIPLVGFKAILGLDDREDALSRYCLTTATYTIEQYCKRRLIRKKHTDYLTFSGDHIFALREYPVRQDWGRWIGMTGNVRGSGKEGEHLEGSLPENVRQLLEPYRRRGV